MPTHHKFSALQVHVSTGLQNQCLASLFERSIISDRRGDGGHDDLSSVILRSQLQYLSLSHSPSLSDVHELAIFKLLLR